jgi:hypothetical protein
MPRVDGKNAAPALLRFAVLPFLSSLLRLPEQQIDPA